MIKIFCVLIALLLAMKSYGWNAYGHRLVAQIAYDQLNKKAKRLCNQYNHALDPFFSPPLSFVDAAAWLDRLYGPKYQGMKEKHYIDLPFSFDNSALKPVQNPNAVSAIEEAKMVLKAAGEDEFNKGFNLRIITHVVADLHQPLHAANQFSKANPLGDKGGNLYSLRKNPIANNLHRYWDRGGGYLIVKNKSLKQLKDKARSLAKSWPCQTLDLNLNPMDWAKESQQLAITKAYLPLERQMLNEKYQKMVKQLTKKQIAKAGCRLAAILNQLVETKEIS